MGWTRSWKREFQHCIAEAQSAGQTVFLSSHILSEVEALCDHVAILRNGRFVELGTLAQMRHLSALAIEVTFSNTCEPHWHVHTRRE